MNLAPLTDTFKSVVHSIDQVGFLDVFFIVMLLIGIMGGFRHGFSKLLFMLLQLIVISTFTLEYSGVVVDLFNIESPVALMLARLFAFAVLTVAFYFVAKLIFDLIAKVLQVKFADFLEKVGGAILGGAFALLLLSFITQFLLIFPGGWLKDTFEKQTLGGPYVLKTAHWIHGRVRWVIPSMWQAYRVEKA